LIERFFNKIKHCLRVATRYDKPAVDSLQDQIRLIMLCDGARVLARSERPNATR
jgi:hypothetical protein